MWKRLHEFRLTPVGGLITMMLVAGVVVLLVGPRHDQNAAFVVLLIVLIVIVGQAAGFRGTRSLTTPTLGERRAEFHPRRRDSGAQEEPSEEAEQDELWRRERDRRAGS